MSAINAEFLPLHLLSLNRYQIADVYSQLFKRPAHSTIPQTIVRIIQIKDRGRVLKACDKARANPEWMRKEEKSRATYQKSLYKESTKRRENQREWRDQNRETVRVLARLRRLTPDSMAKSLAHRRSHCEENKARSRAWWQAMSSAERKKYVVDQWIRRKAKLKADPKLYEACKEQHKRALDARRAKAAFDPIVRAKLEATKAKRKKWAKEKAANKTNWYHRVCKTDPVKLKKRREQIRRAMLRRKLKRKLDKPGEAIALKATISGLIPRSFPPQLKADLCQDLFIAVLAGETTVKELPQILKTKSRKALKLLGETWKQRSLNETIPGTNGLTLLDRLQADHQHF